MSTAVNDQHAGKQLDFVIKQIKRHRARQKGCVHEDTFAERHFVRDGPRLGEEEGGTWGWMIRDGQIRVRLVKTTGSGGVGGQRGFLGENNLDISDGEPGLSNHNGRRAGHVVSESDLPRAFVDAPMFDGLVEEGVANQRKQKRQNKVLCRAL